MKIEGERRRFESQMYAADGIAIAITVTATV